MSHAYEPGIDPEYQDSAQRSLAGGPLRPVRQGQPPGLWVLFITEMWERFSYYGMRAILVLFLYTTTASILADGTANNNPGFGWSEADAYTLYGLYTFMVYLGGILGGIAADRVLGTHRSMLLGGWVIALGHITLAISGLFSVPAGTSVSLESGGGALITFLLGLTLIIIGTGLFKPCVSVMVGQLYSEHDPRRDSGFTIFYMGINLGAFFSPLVAGTLGEKVGWHWGFGSAAVGMLVGLFFYQVIRPRYLGTIGMPPRVHWNGREVAWFAGVMGLLIALPGVPLLLYATGGLGPIVEAWNSFAGALGLWGMTALIIAVLLAAILTFIFLQPPATRAPLAVIVILAFLGNIFFWTAFEQAGSSLNVFADAETDRTLWGLWGDSGDLPSDVPAEQRAAIVAGEGFPASWYQSINPLCILLFAPLFAWLWVWLDRRNLNPSTPMKFAIGLWLLGLSFIAMVFGALEARGPGLAGPHWLLIMYVVVTWGELCLSPVGLSMVTKLSPPHLQSRMMGFWFFTFALSNLLAGLVARFSTRVESGEITFMIEGLPGFFLMLVIVPSAMGVLILLLAPLLKRMMHGVK